MSLYGTRDAAQNLQTSFISVMQSIGFVTGTATPCNFHHPRLDVTCTVHGGDFTSCGPENAIEWFKAKISAKYESKPSILGPGNKHEKTISESYHNMTKWFSVKKKGLERELEISVVVEFFRFLFYLFSILIRWKIFVSTYFDYLLNTSIGVAS